MTRTLTLSLIAIAALLAAVASMLAAQPAEGATGDVFVSTSGIPHRDVGNLKRSAQWRPGMPNAINPSWHRAFDDVIGAIADEQPRAVFHTGDMVEGRWTKDVDNVGVFGPDRTEAQRRRVIRRAGRLYYRFAKARWAEHGLRPHYAIGDHEIGDLAGGRYPQPPGMFKTRALPVFRDVWHDEFVDGRYRLQPPRGQQRRASYARQIGSVGLVSLDPFLRLPDGLHVRVGTATRAWIREVVPQLRRQGARWIIVQTEIPPLGPNDERGTSALTLEHGADLMRMFDGLGVHLVLAAEFHAPTTHTDRGTTPVQVVHGGSLAGAHNTYLRIVDRGDRLQLTLKGFEGRVQQREPGLWALSRQRAVRRLDVPARPTVVGRMTIHRDGSTSHRTGELQEG